MDDVVILDKDKCFELFKHEFGYVTDRVNSPTIVSFFESIGLTYIGYKDAKGKGICDIDCIYHITDHKKYFTAKIKYGF